jgi:hypothetical protein
VADGALEPGGGTTCHHCRRTDVPIYSYNGFIVDPRLAKDADLARKEHRVFELCDDCIRGGNVRKDEYDVKQVVRLLEGHAADKARAIEEYHRTPDLALFQGATWPLCCGELAEYIGEQPAPGSAYESYELWDATGLAGEFQLADFYPLEKLSVMHTMALFRCQRCPRGFWVFHYSGLFWPGPLAEQ